MTTNLALEGAAALSHWGVIRAQGADAATFLHGQLTQDFATLDTARARLAGYCSPKGRLLASFVAFKLANDDILLACSADVLAPTLKRLSMFVLRAKCKLSDASAAWRLFGLAGPAAVSLLGADAPEDAWGVSHPSPAHVVRLPDAAGSDRFLWVAPVDVTAPALPALDHGRWRLGEVESGIVTIEAATVDQFVPQMLNYEVLGGVDFKKGCYPGQEVVARSQYRGTIKRRTFLFRCPAPLVAGQEVFHSDDPAQPAGLVAQAAPGPGDRHSALVEVKLAALETGSLHLGAADGPALMRAELPYAVPSDAA